MSNRPFNSGRKLNTDKIQYMTLYREMLKAKKRPYGVCKEIGVADRTFMDRMRGRSEWKLWEAIETKKAIGSDLPIEELFSKI